MLGLWSKRASLDAMLHHTTSEQDKRKILESRRRVQSNTKPATASASKATKKDILEKYYSRKAQRTGQPKTDSERGSKSVSFGNQEKNLENDVEKKTQGATRSYAGAVKATPIQATCSMVAAEPKKKPKPPREHDVKDPHGDEYPIHLGPGEVARNQDSRDVICEEEVLLDSGASHNMANALQHLDLLELAFAIVSLADGSIQHCHYKGLMRIAATDVETGQEVVFLMADTLLVPGLRTVLWSVAALSAQGHEVLFGDTTVTIALHSGTDQQMMI